MFEFIETEIQSNSFQTLGLLVLIFLLLSLVLFRGIQSLFSSHRTSQKETQILLRELRSSTVKKFLIALGFCLLIDLGLRFLNQNGIQTHWGNPEIASAAYLGIFLSALAEACFGSAVILFVSVMTRPLSQFLGGLVDLGQSLIFVAITGWLVQHFAEFEFFKKVISNIPIALVVMASSFIYSMTGSIIGVWGSFKKVKKSA